MNRRTFNPQNFGCGGTIVLVAVLLVVLSLFWSAEQVDTGHVRVVLRNGMVTGRVLEPGLSFITPFIDHTRDYNTQLRSYETSDFPQDSNANYRDFSINANTSDGQQMTIGYTVQFRVTKDAVLGLALNVGTMDDIVENIIKAHSRSVARLLAQLYTAEDFFNGSGIQEYQANVAGELVEHFAVYGIVLADNGFLVRGVVFKEEYVNAIEDQQIAQETIQTEGFNAEAAAFRAQSQIREAEGEAESIRLLADAEAYSITVRGEALEEYPDVIQLEFISQLEGVVWGILPSDKIDFLLNGVNTPTFPE